MGEVEAIDESKEHILYVAIQNNDKKKALEILSDGDHYSNEYVAKNNKHNWTMLHWAAFHGNEEVRIFMLLTNKSSYSSYDKKSSFLMAHQILAFHSVTKYYA